MNEMTTIVIDPVLIEVGLPALGIGLLLGALIVWLLARGRQRKLEDELTILESRLKDQDALQVEREAAFDKATSQLASAFSELSNQSLRVNSENFLRMAEQNLNVHQEKAKRDVDDR